MGGEKQGKKKEAAPKPFFSNPSDEYHRLNKNKRRCLTAASFFYWIAPHIGGPSSGRKGSFHKLYTRMAAILEQLVISRTPESTFIAEAGLERKCGQVLSSMTVYRQDKLAMRRLSVVRHCA